MIIFEEMGDHARGDCKKMINSSEEDELQQEVFRNSLYISPTTAVMISQLNSRDKRFPAPGTSGEEPAIPAPPTADDTDRQFWAEDELSSSESRMRLVCRQRRRHSLAYRNSIAIRKRSRSLLCQSSSSNSDRAVRMKILSPARCNVRRRRRCNHKQGPSTIKKLKGGNTVSLLRSPTPLPSPDYKIQNSSIVGTSFQFGIQHPNSKRRIKASYISPARRRSGSRRNQISNLPHDSNLVLPTNNNSEQINVNKHKNDNPRPPSTSKR